MKSERTAAESLLGPISPVGPLQNHGLSHQAAPQKQPEALEAKQDAAAEKQEQIAEVSQHLVTEVPPGL